MTETDSRPRVLFLCTHNAARSQIAEAFLHHYAGDRFEARARTQPTQVHPLTREVLTETGLDPSRLRAKSLDAFLGRVRIHYAIIVCDEAEEHCPRLYPFALQTLYWPFDDPTQVAGSRQECLRTFRNVRDQIAHQVWVWLDTRKDSA